MLGRERTWSYFLVSELKRSPFFCAGERAAHNIKHRLAQLILALRARGDFFLADCLKAHRRNHIHHPKWAGRRSIKKTCVHNTPKYWPKFKYQQLPFSDWLSADEIYLHRSVIARWLRSLFAHNEMRRRRGERCSLPITYKCADARGAQLAIGTALGRVHTRPV
jgi:hypothetical protein